MILGEIKGAKLSFSPDFQTLIKHKFPFMYFLYELLMSLRTSNAELVRRAVIIVDLSAAGTLLSCRFCNYQNYFWKRIV